MRFEVDVGVGPGEAHQEPALPLAAIAPTPQLAVQLGGKIVEQLLLEPGHDFEMLPPHADFLPHLAQQGGLDILAVVDPALGHLPPVALAVVDPLADESLAFAVDKHDAHAGAVLKMVALTHARGDRHSS